MFYRFDTEDKIENIGDSLAPKYLLGIVFKQDDNGLKGDLWVDRDNTPCAATGTACSPKV